MPQFQYEVKKGPGPTTTGVLEAENQRAAVARLRDMGYFPLKVEEFSGKAPRPAKPTKSTTSTKTDKPAAPAARAKSPFPFRSGVKLQDRNLFFRQLANLNESGMIITRALRTLVDQTENPKLKEVIDDLRETVQQGNSFAEALEKHPKLFPPMYVALVRAGEAGGMLEEVLWRIVTFGEQEEELRGKAISAAVYPIFLTVVGAAAIFILISFVFPKFVDIFEEFNAELPMPTKIVMAICDFMGSYWWAVLFVFFSFLYFLIRYFRTELGRKQFDTLLLKIPALKNVVLKYEMAKFARTLGTLLDNGVPVLTAIRITASTVSNSAIREQIATVHTGVTEGESLSESLRNCSYFPPMVVSMFAVGEESGRIGAVAKRVADAYDVEVDRAVKALTSLFEPILIVVMGIIVGFLVIAMLLPMLTLSTTVGA